MAFAYSQLGDIHNAGEAFLHAFQAAKDSGNNIQSIKYIHVLKMTFHDNFDKKFINTFIS